METINIKHIYDTKTVQGADCYAYMLEHGFDIDHFAQTATHLDDSLALLIRQRGFTGGAGTQLVATLVVDGRPVHLFLFGVGHGDSREQSIEHYRRAIGRLVRAVEQHKLRAVVLELSERIQFGVSFTRLAQETAVIARKASYHFDEFITRPARKIAWSFDLLLNAPSTHREAVEEGVKRGLIIGNAINQARYWCDMPPSRLTPTIFAQDVQKYCAEDGLSVKVFDEKKIAELGMGGLIGVSRGSAEEARFVIVEYEPARAGCPTVALVGKGVTFDSGGLSLKPAVSMETMKDDMAGAAVVLAAMHVIAQIKPDVRVVAFAPLTENLPGCRAIKPGDVLKFYNGMTAEVKNTDAEGRLILADALSYAAKEYKPDAIIDLATLTGACAAFLGPFYAGLLGQSEELIERVIDASHSSGDRVWRLPFDDDYKKAIESDIADMQNIGSPRYKAGVITATAFLHNFVGDVPWVHLDIAGTAFGVPDRSYLRRGATGFGIRLLADLLANWAEKK